MSFLSAATWWPLLVGLIGLFIGSYLNVVALRWFGLKTESPQNLSSRSKCPHCNHKLSWYELIPLVSFLAQRGRCRHCDRVIDWRYPLVEVLTSIVFYLLAVNFLNFLQLAILLILASTMIVIGLIDLKTQLIPDRLTYPTIILSFLLLAILLKNNFLDFSSASIDVYHWLIGLVIGLVIPGLIVLVTKGKGMGVGDIKLGGIIGITLGGVYAVVALFVAFVAGALVGLFLITKNKANLKTALPFGPFLVLGWLIAIIWGPEIVAWYTNIAYL